MASTLEDRTRAVSLATGAFVLGISIGPSIQVRTTFLRFIDFVTVMIFW